MLIKLLLDRCSVEQKFAATALNVHQRTLAYWCSGDVRYPRAAADALIELDKQLDQLAYRYPSPTWYDDFLSRYPHVAKWGPSVQYSVLHRVIARTGQTNIVHHPFVTQCRRNSVDANTLAALADLTESKAQAMIDGYLAPSPEAKESVAQIDLLTHTSVDAITPE